MASSPRRPKGSSLPPFPALVSRPRLTFARSATPYSEETDGWDYSLQYAITTVDLSPLPLSVLPVAPSQQNIHSLASISLPPPPPRLPPTVAPLGYAWSWYSTASLILSTPWV